MSLVNTKNFVLAINSRGKVGADWLAIMLPGRLDTKDYDCFNKHIEFLAEKGFYAIAMDPPGTWGSSGGIKLFTTTNYIKAVNELIEYFGNRPTLLVGHSRGGAVANIVGTNNPLVKGVVSIMASFGAPSPASADAVRAGVEIDFRDLPPGINKSIKQKRFEVPLNYFVDGGSYDDAKVLKTCKKPKLIFYGTEDEFNSPEEVREVFSSLPQPKAIHELKCDHDYRYYPEIIEEINLVMGRFIDECIVKLI